MQLLGVGYHILWKCSQNSACTKCFLAPSSVSAGKAVEVGGVDFCIYAMFIAWQQGPPIMPIKVRSHLMLNQC